MLPSPPALKRASIRTTLHLAGMTAVHAIRAVETALGAVPTLAHIDVRLGVAVLEHDQPLDEGALRAAVEAAGVTVVRIEVEGRRLIVRDEG